MAANKVFIVEDDAVIARAVAAHLTTWQMQVQCAGNFEKITEEADAVLSKKRHVGSEVFFL